MRVAEHTTTIDHVPVFYRTAGDAEQGVDGGAQEIPVLYLHDALMSSDDMVPFLERTGGVAPDLIGFGRSAKGGHLNYSPDGLVEFLERFVAHLKIEPVRLVGHGWGGALGLLMALRRPTLVQRLVLIDAVPLLDGFTWHRTARLWRRRLIGELLMGSTSRRLLTRQLRKGVTKRDAWSTGRADAIWEQFDQGTQRALLRLHRAADESQLAQLGVGLASLSAPALVIWGDDDPWFGAEFADAYADQLPDGRVKRIPGAGHWPWLEQPCVLDLIAEFLSAP